MLSGAKKLSLRSRKTELQFISAKCYKFAHSVWMNSERRSSSGLAEAGKRDCG